MKVGKKLLFGLTALMLAFGFAACGGENTAESSSAPASESSSLVEDSSDSSIEDSSVEETDPWADYEIITIKEALQIAETATAPTTERYYIRGIVKELNVSYGEMTIEDETGSIYVYGTYSIDGALKFSELSEKPIVGDEVLLHCTLQNYNGTLEVQNARLIDFVSKPINVDDSDYTEMTIADARAAQDGALVKVDGVVARITYANGMVPSGVYLVDETQSIYVYDGNLASSVSIGNTITVIGEKDYWILESEQNSAAKFNYKGCNQISNATLVANDKETSDFNTGWITESTIKEIMETPVEQDITTTIFKVNALVTKAPGNGFTNYYFNDLDGTTGSYTYTQCNGKDFSWLDQFDGKICSVYLSVINAKSTATGCVYRFLPILVEDENFTFDLNDAAEFAVKYHAVDQFMPLYNADPAKEMVTSVSSELLKFENATLSYASSNTEVVNFEVVDGKTVMHCVGNGTATITITGSFNGKTYQETVEVKFVDPESFDYISVAEAIAVAPNQEGDGSKVTVRGIVGPSVVNKNGFYLFGEDGSMISVLVNDVGQFENLEIGHEVILTGVRERYIKDDANTTAGQTCIVNAVIEANLYGNHEYSTAKFTDLTVAQFSALDKTVDYSTTVFVVTATVQVIETAYYSNIKLVGADGQSISVYCSGANQYKWLLAFKDQEVTLEIAPCNWNDKSFWAACVLAARTADGKIINSLNFDNN